MTRGSSPFDRDSSGWSGRSASGSPDHDPLALDPDSRRPRPGRGAVGRLGGDGPRHRGRQPPPLSGAARAGPARERVGRRLARRSARRGRPVAARQGLRRGPDDDRAPCRRQRSHAPQASLWLPVRLALRHRGRGALPGRCRARSRRPPRAPPWRPAPAAPGDGHALVQVPGCTPRVITRWGDAILEAVARGLALGEDELPRIEHRPRPRIAAAVQRRIERLRQWRSEAAPRVGIEPGLLLPNRLITVIALAGPRDRAELARVDGVRRWRAEAFGGEMVTALGPA